MVRRLFSGVAAFALMTSVAFAQAPHERYVYVHRHHHGVAEHTFKWGVIGAGAGALIGCVVTLPVCGPGAGVGAAIGGGTGAVGGAATAR